MSILKTLHIDPYTAIPTTIGFVVGYAFRDKKIGPVNAWFGLTLAGFIVGLIIENSQKTSQ